MVKLLSNNNNTEMSFIEHLETLRWHLIRSAIALFLGAIIIFLNYHFIFDHIILRPKMSSFITNKIFAKLADELSSSSLRINDKPLEIINISMAGQFATHIKISIIGGIIIAFPYIFHELWSFIKPALYEKEIKKTRGAVFFTTSLFILGVLFGYYLITPLSIHFLGGYVLSDSITNQINLGSYISTVTSIVLAGGIIFELPMIVYVLSKVGILTPRFMKHYRKHAYVLLLLISAILTPPDVFSQILVCIPLAILYEISIKISKSIESKENLNDDYDDLDDKELIL